MPAAEGFVRQQLFLCGIAVCCLGGIFLLLGTEFALPPSPLTLAPASGPAGTMVTVTGSGLPSGSTVYIYWEGETQGNDTYFFVASGDVNSGGGFTPSASFQVPSSPLGMHNVTVSSVALGPATEAIPSGDVLATAQFNVSDSAPTQSTSSGQGSGPSPIEGWGGISIGGGVVLMLASFFMKERREQVEPPAGYRFCPFCSTTVELAAERCPMCNGLQPKEGEG